tara:strand:+ start:98 stop:394 length:297 start_codon:yes stop_codon:yes gene_type:complete
MYNVEISFEGHTVKGWADLCGPYAEIEGSEVTSVSPPNSDEAFRDRAMDAVVSAAYKMHQEAFAGHSHPDDYDDYDDGNYQSGPDYWIDRESGEYRCG